MDEFKQKLMAFCKTNEYEVEIIITIGSYYMVRIKAMQTGRIEKFNNWLVENTSYHTFPTAEDKGIIFSYIKL